MVQSQIRRSFLFTFFLLTSLYSAYSQSFAGFGGNISNSGSRNFYNASVTGLSGGINTSYGLFGVSVNIAHTAAGDLDIFIISPDNTVVELSSGNGGANKNYDNCLFTNQSSNKISNAKAPFNGSFKPEGSLGVLNNGQNPNGTWRLMVIDRNRNKDSGQVKSWSLIFNNTPSKLEPFVNSNLPLLLINTHNKTINDEPRIYANMRAINNSSGVNTLADSSKYFNFNISIEARGSTSQGFPKRPYGFTTLDKSLVDTNVTLLGFPSEHDWVLNATYNDKSLMRDVLTYTLARRTGNYATRCKYLELFINGKYEGIYVLMEKVKRDKNRVDISKLEPKDSTGVNLTGGYIIKIDKTTGNNNGGWVDSFPISPGSGTKVYYQYDYPNGPDMVQQQKNYIRDALYKFEIALSASNYTDKTNGYRKYIDVNTFIDYSIMNEISKNVDGYRLSTYLFKDKDSKDGRFKMGPIWDFNLAWNNADYNNSSDPTGWEIDLSFGCPFWWKRMRQDTGFMSQYYCRWNQLRQTTFHLKNLNAFIDSTYNYLEEASYRNFERWPVMGIYIWPNPSPLSYSMKEEVEGLKSWIEKRCVWFDSELAANCKSITVCKPRIVALSDKTIICKGQSTLLFADGVGSTFTWFPTTGLSSSTGRQVIASPSTSTKYRVVMRTSAGCTDTAYITVTVLTLPSKAITGNTSLCEGGNTTLNAAKGSKFYTWSPATGLDKTTGPTVISTPIINTTYKLVVMDSFGCKDSNFVTVRVNPKPKMGIGANKTTVCIGDTATITVTGANTYRWANATGLNDTSGSVVKVIPNNTLYMVYGTSSFGCKDTTGIFIANFPQAAVELVASQLQICYGSSNLISSSNGQLLTWRPTADFKGGQAITISVSPKVKTVYSAFGLNKYGCSDSGKITIDVIPEMNVSVSGDTIICNGNFTFLTCNGANNYKWSPPNGLNTTTQSLVKASPTKTTTYKIIGTTNNLCSDTTYKTIIVNDKPVVKISPISPVITQGQKVVLYASGAKTYRWSPNVWINQTTGDSITATPFATIQYFVIGTDKNSCTQTDSVLITVNPKLGLSPRIVENDIKIFPNPAFKNVTIEVKTAGNLKIFTMDGRLVNELSLVNGVNLVEVDHLQSGVYVFEVVNEGGKQVKRVVIGEKGE